MRPLRLLLLLTVASAAPVAAKPHPRAAAKPAHRVATKTHHHVAAPRSAARPRSMATVRAPDAAVRPPAGPQAGPEAGPEAGREAGREDRAGLGVLFHASPERVKARLGDPDVARSEVRGALWTYRLPHCALFVFFTESSKRLRVTGADTGPRKRGDPVQSVPACLASAVTPPEPERADPTSP